MTWAMGMYQTMTRAYPKVIGLVLERGDEVAPDGKSTRELLDVTFSIQDIATGGVPIGLGRKVGTKPMAIDGIGNLSGRAFPSVILATGPFMGRFSDTLVDDDPPLVLRRAGAKPGEPFFQGTYGPRMARQLRQAEEELRLDPWSRRAVVNVWDSRTDYSHAYRDRPCTSQLQFIQREGRLDLFVTMRSNDLWTGTAYDVWQFGQVLQAMAHVLGYKVGAYHHRAISLHAYETDYERLRAITGRIIDNPREDPGPDWSALDPGEYGSMDGVQCSFGRIGWKLSLGERVSVNNHIEQWYLDHLVEAPVKESV